MQPIIQVVPQEQPKAEDIVSILIQFKLIQPMRDEEQHDIVEDAPLQIELQVNEEQAQGQQQDDHHSEESKVDETETEEKQDMPNSESEESSDDDKNEEEQEESKVPPLEADKDVEN